MYQDDKVDSKIQIYSNYKRNNKFLGIIDYKSLTLLIIYMVIIGYILILLNIKMEYCIYIYIIVIVPAISIILINVDNENAVDTITNIFKYLLSRKVFIKGVKNINNFCNEKSRYVKINKKCMYCKKSK